MSVHDAAPPPRLAVDANGFCWRVYPTHWSMCPVNPDNTSVPQPVTYYVPVGFDPRDPDYFAEADAEARAESAGGTTTTGEAEAGDDRSAVASGAPTWLRGTCPACGCTGTLFVGDGGYVTCSWHVCPNPAAADELLSGTTGDVSSPPDSGSEPGREVALLRARLHAAEQAALAWKKRNYEKEDEITDLMARISRANERARSTTEALRDLVEEFNSTNWQPQSAERARAALAAVGDSA